MEDINNTGIPVVGEKREGHEVNDVNPETDVQNEVEETKDDDNDQKNETAEMKMTETDNKIVDQENDTKEKKIEETDDAKTVDHENDTEEKKIGLETDSGDDGGICLILTLSWEDIMFRNVLPFLRWDDLFRLRATCFEAKCMVDAYFEQQKKMDLSVVQCRFNGEALKVVSANCTQLRTLIIQRGKWLTDKDIIPIFKQNKHLNYLDLTDCGNLTGTCLLALAVNCKQLKTLILQYCAWLNQGAMETLIAHTDCLENVDLTGCNGLSNDTLLPFVQRFKLKQFQLMNLYRTVNDQTMLLIARERGDTLEYLDVSGCINVSDWGVKMVAEYCKNLKALYIAGNYMVTEESLRIFRERGVELDQDPVSGDPLPYVPFPFLQV